MNKFDKMRFVLLTIATVLITVSAMAQGVTVRGTVSDQKGAALPGVNVVIEGTTKGVVTDKLGQYSLTTSAQDRISFSSMGYKSIVLPVETVR